MILLTGSHFLFLPPRSLLSPFFFFFFYTRCLLLRPLRHHHLRQRRPSGDRSPDPPFPNSLQAKLYGAGLPVTAAVHHGASSLHGQPVPGGVRSQVLPLQRCGAQLLFGRLHGGRKRLMTGIGEKKKTKKLSRLLKSAIAYSNAKNKEEELASIIDKPRVI